MKKKIYVCGPITGLPGLNVDEFRAAAAQLEGLGFRAVVPHDLFDGVDTADYEHKDYMKRCLEEMMTCDGLLVLPGWDESKGAKQEVNIARHTEFLTVHFAWNIDAMLRHYGVKSNGREDQLVVHPRAGV